MPKQKIIIIIIISLRCHVLKSAQFRRSCRFMPMPSMLVYMRLRCEIWFASNNLCLIADCTHTMRQPGNLWCRGSTVHTWNSAESLCLKVALSLLSLSDRWKKRWERNISFISDALWGLILNEYQYLRVHNSLFGTTNTGNKANTSDTHVILCWRRIRMTSHLRLWMLRLLYHCSTPRKHHNEKHKGNVSFSFSSGITLSLDVILFPAQGHRCITAVPSALDKTGRVSSSFHSVPSIHF